MLSFFFLTISEPRKQNRIIYSCFGSTVEMSHFAIKIIYALQKCIYIHFYSLLAIRHRERFTAVDTKAEKTRNTRNNENDGIFRYGRTHRYYLKKYIEKFLRNYDKAKGL